VSRTDRGASAGRGGRAARGAKGTALAAPRSGLVGGRRTAV